MSVLAMGGFALSLLGCIPPLSLLGSVMGAVAVRRIAVSNGTLRGRRLAQAAMYLGLILGMVGFLSWWRIGSVMQQWTNDSIETAARGFVVAVQGSDWPAARRHWIVDPAVRLHDADFKELGESLSERFGSVRRFSASNVVPVGGVYSAAFDVAGVFMFERGDRPGALQVVLVPSLGFSMPDVRIRRLSIDDVEQGDVVFPPAHGASSMQRERERP